MSKGPASLPTSPVAFAFPHIQWDPLGSLRLTAQETALLRMAETNPIEYTLADSRDASMYARVLLKLLAEASAAGAGTGEVSKIVETCTDEQAMQALDLDPLGVVTHYALSKLSEIIYTLSTGVSGVTVGAVFYVGKDGVLVDQWKALLRILNKGGKGDAYTQKGAARCLALMLITSCPSMRNNTNVVAKDGQVIKPRPISYASAVEPLEALTAWVVSQLKNATGTSVGLCIPALTALMSAHETRILFCTSGGVKYLSRQLRIGTKGAALASVGNNKKKMGQASVQQLYELSFCLWSLTYELDNNYAVRCDFAKESLTVAALTDLVSIAPREKVVRIALAALRNLAKCHGEISPPPAGANAYDGVHFLCEMIACGLMKAVDHLRDRQFTDPDIIDGEYMLYMCCVTYHHASMHIHTCMYVFQCIVL
jgi:V-ATPase subunit H